MIKGCSKRMIQLKDTGSDFFEEAYFILKTSSPFCALRSERDFIAEANRIVAESRGVPTVSAPKREKKRTTAFLAGVLCGGVLCLLLCTLFRFGQI